MKLSFEEQKRARTEEKRKEKKAKEDIEKSHEEGEEGEEGAAGTEEQNDEEPDTSTTVIGCSTSLSDFIRLLVV